MQKNREAYFDRVLKGGTRSAGQIHDGRMDRLTDG